MNSVRYLTNAGRRISQNYYVVVLCSFNSTRPPILQHVVAKTEILKHFSSTNVSNDGTKKSAPPPPPISGGGGRGHRDGLNCPKCGDPCTHVETFVSEYILCCLKYKLMIIDNHFTNLFRN